MLGAVVLLFALSCPPYRYYLGRHDRALKTTLAVELAPMAPGAGDNSRDVTETDIDTKVLRTMFNGEDKRPLEEQVIPESPYEGLYEDTPQVRGDGAVGRCGW